MFATLCLIFCAALGMHVSCTPPAPAAPKEQRVLNDVSTVNPAMTMYRYTCWFHAAIETLILVLPAVARQLPQSTTIRWINETFFGTFLPASPGQEIPTIFFPPLRILGAFLMIFGSTLRYMCFRELGRHFTFHVALLDNHTLVTTGPYSIVRHPSYSSGVFVVVGSLLWHATSGSWLMQSRLYENIFAWVTFLPGIIVTWGAIFVGAVTRPAKEDELLKKGFGKEWDEYAKRVPYRLFPGIY